MPKKREAKTYSFDELSPEAKEKALEDYRSDAWDQTDVDWLTEDFEQVLEEKGLPNDKVYWSLGHVQGDGVGFYGPLDVEDYLKKNGLMRRFSKLVPFVSAKITGEHGRYHGPGSMDMEIELHGGPEDLVPDKLRDEMQEWQRDRSRLFERWHGKVAEIQRQRMAPVIEWERRRGEWEKKRGTGPKEWAPGSPGPWKPTPFDIPLPPRPEDPSEPEKLKDAREKAEQEWTELESLVHEFEAHLKEHVDDVAGDLAEIGYAEIEYRTGDEGIAEFFMANEWRFLEDGVRLR
jgi:hypothetical protein